jgi:hypothetical protein
MFLRCVLLLTSIAICAAAQTWTPPLAPDGHPDLQGNWVNKSATPLERPKQFEGHPVLTDAEVAELKRRADRIINDSRSDFAAGDNLFLATLANPDHYKSPTATGNATDMPEYEFDNRTSLIVDPPDGRFPPYTPAGQKRQAALAAARLARNIVAGPQDLTADQRCITFGVPRVGGNYSSGGVFGLYEIVQTPGYVVLFSEAIHDARIIPLDGRPHLPPSVHTWSGDSRGRWEGGTLVVDTTNFTAAANFYGSSDGLHLTERFTRVAADEIRYEIKVDDPTTWARPWTAMVRLKRTDDPVYEFACHEGNDVTMPAMLGAAQADGRTK